MKKGSHQKFITLDYPWILNIFGSRNPIIVMLFSSLLFVFFAYKISLTSTSMSTIPLLGLIALGMIYWSFLEYAIHRFIYHSKTANSKHEYTLGAFHIYHHQNMFDLRVLNAGPIMIYTAAILTIAPVQLLFNNWFVSSGIGIGLLSSYVFYECVHYLIHYKKFESGYLNYIQNYHFYHHEKAPLKNFGNTTHIWDMLLGTYDKRYKTFEMSEKSFRSLITSQAQTELYE